MFLNNNETIQMGVSPRTGLRPEMDVDPQMPDRHQNPHFSPAARLFLCLRDPIWVPLGCPIARENIWRPVLSLLEMTPKALVYRVFFLSPLRRLDRFFDPLLPLVAQPLQEEGSRLPLLEGFSSLLARVPMPQLHS